MKRCAETGKKKYADELTAALALGYLRGQAARELRHGKAEARHYRCDHCGFWHLTSQRGEMA